MKPSPSFRVFLFSLGAVGLTAAEPAFDAWAEATTQAWVRSDPQRATETQYLPVGEQDALERELALRLPDGLPLDAAARAQRAEWARRGLEELERFPRTELTPVQRVSAEVLAWRFRDELRRIEVADQWPVFDQVRGPQVALVDFLARVHPLRTPRDVENYLARLARVGPLLDAAVAEARGRAERGIVPPRFVLTAAIEGLDRFLAAATEDNVLVTSLEARGAGSAGLSEAEWAAKLASAQRLVADSVRPAMQRVRALLIEQRERAGDEAGATRLPRGAALYAAMLAHHTTTGLGATEVRNVSLREEERLEREMDPLLVTLGQRDGRIVERYCLFQALQIPASRPDPRPRMVAQWAQAVRDAEQRSEALLGVRPRAAVEVRRQPVPADSTEEPRYAPPAAEGTGPAVLWLPLGRLRYDVWWIGAGLRSTVYREVAPGRHILLALQQEAAELPRFRRLRAYGEIEACVAGWALYAEQLADEAGWYAGDDGSRLGYLALQLQRTRQAVADTGLHAQQWSRERTMDYGFPLPEVERSAVSPGEAVAAMIGRLRLLELRARAQAALGEKFSARGFHLLLLRTGEVPLDVLRPVVEAWIAERAGR